MPLSEVAILLGALALAGWLTALMLALFLHRVFGRWKLAFRDRQWVATPISELVDARRELDRASRASTTSAQRSEDALREAAATRQEFGILRTELQSKSDEIKEMKLGAEYHLRRPMLLGLARIQLMISGDAEAKIPPEQTLQGVAVEVAELLDEHQVIPWLPEVGLPASGLGGRMNVVAYVHTSEEGAVGTVADVTRPGMVYHGPTEVDVLVPAQARVYRIEEHDGADRRD